MSHAAMDIKDFAAIAPGVVSGMRALEKGVEAARLDKSLIELLKIRISQFNGCGYCLQYHLNLARKLGVAPAKTDLVAVWREVDIFDSREQAALAWGEALTRMGETPVPGEIHEALKPHFSTGEIAHLTGAIAHINAWNRIAGALRFAPPIPE